MKILLSAYACEPHRGSEPGYGWNWSNYLANEVDVYCLTTEDGKAEIEKLYEFIPANLKFIFVKLPHFINKMYNFPVIGNYIHYFLWQNQALKTAKVLHKTIKFDYVHHVTYGSFQMGSSLWRLKIPMIFGPVGGGQHAPAAFRKYFGKKWNNEILRKIVSFLFLKFNPNCRRTVQYSKVVLVSNEETYKLAKKLKAKTVEMFFDPSVPENFFPEENTKRTYTRPLKLLWVGRLMTRKGLELTLDAFSKVNSNMEISLTIVGNGELGKNLNKIIDDLALKLKVNWVGQVPYAKVQEYYKTHDLFVFTSLRDSCPAQFLEAMGFGLPILTLNIHGSKLFVPDNAGIKVNAIDPEQTIRELAYHIEELYENPELLKTMSENAFVYAKQHTWEKKVNYIINKFYN